MKDHRLSTYRKIGDIAGQIESLEIKKERDNFPSKIDIMGGGRIETKEDLINTIHFQWSRLEFLEELLDKKYEDVKQQKTILYSNLCSRCKAGEGLKCEKDFFTHAFYKLIEAII